jgi:hypothetical protein
MSLETPTSSSSDDEEPAPPRDAIKEALQRLPLQERELVLAAFQVGNSLFCRWRDRYEAADRALRALGATRTPRGRRTRRSLWRMPCGCTYELFYAQAITVRNCPRHPGERVTARTIAAIAKGCLASLLFAAAGSSVTVLALTVYEALTGELTSSFLRVATIYAVVGGAAALLLWALIRKRTPASRGSGPRAAS